MSFTMADAVVAVSQEGAKGIPQEAAREIDSNSGPVKESGSNLGRQLAAGIGAGLLAAGISDLVMSGLSVGADTSKMAAELGLSPEEMGAAGKLAGELYSQNYGSSISNVNDAIVAVKSSIGGMRDANDDAVGQMSSKLLGLESVFGIDVGRGAQVAGQLITQGLAKDGAGAADLLTAALQRVPSALRGDLVDAIDEYGPSFSALGIGGQEAFGLLVTASQKGMYGIDKTGDALKEFTIRATDMSSSTGAVYDQLGLNQQEYTNMLLAGGDQASDAFNTIVTGLQRIEDPAARSNAALALFGTPLEDLSVNDIPKFLSGLQEGGSSMDGFAGSADAMAATLGDNAASRVETMRRSLEMMGQNLVTTQGPLGDVAAMAAALGPDALSAAGGAAMLGGSFISAAAGIGPLLASMKTWKIVTLLGAAAQGVATAAQWAFNAAAAANPVGIIILAITALIAAIVLLVMNWDTVVSFITDIWGGFVAWFQGIMAGFLGWWSGIWTEIVGFFQSIFGPIVEWAISTWNQLVLGWQILGAILTEWWNSLWTGIVEWFQTTFGPLIEIASKMWELWGLAWQVVGQVLSDWWNSLWTSIGDFFRSIFEPVIQWGMQTWSNLQLGFAIIGQVLTAWWNNLWNNVGSFFQSTFGPVIEWGKTTWEGLSSGFRSVGDALGSWWSGLWSNIVGGFRSSVGFISGLVAQVIGFFTDMQGRVTGALSGAANWLYTAGRQIIDGLTKGIRDTVGAVAGAITSGLDSAISSAKSFLGIASPSRLFRDEVGVMIGRGTAIGIDRQADNVESSMRDLVALPADLATPANVTAISAAPSYVAPTGGDTIYNTYDVRIDASNVRDFERVVDIFAEVERASRTGKAA